MNLVTIRAGSHAIAGTLAGLKGEPRIVMVDDHPVEVPPAEHMVVVRNDDSVGRIAVVTAALAAAGVNIADMHIGRVQGGTAMMVISVDQPVPAEVLDALREHLHFTGSKKGCDQGQCGACTVIAGGRRIVSCLSLAVMHQDDDIVTIEGLGTPDNLHPMQAAFVKHDGYQCGYCTPGQICSAVAVLDEIKAGIPSHVSAILTAEPELTSAELRERMSGNICRCGAYSNIVDAITEVAGRQS